MSPVFRLAQEKKILPITFVRNTRTYLNTLDWENESRKAVNSGYENVLKKSRLLVSFYTKKRLYLFLDVIGVRFAVDLLFVSVDRQRPSNELTTRVFFGEKHPFRVLGARHRI